MTSVTPEADIFFDVTDGVAQIRLNRPETINALTVEMIEQIDERLVAWVDDDAVERVEMSGEGERGFCAGADVRRLRRAIVDGHMALAQYFLRIEYVMNERIATYPKPITSHFRGVSMGGGLGLGLHVDRRVAAKDLKLAMPEVGIGLWPDVGVGFELARMPRRTGWLIALTGQTLDAVSALWAGLVDLVDAGVNAEESQLAADAEWAEQCLTAGSVLEAVRNLEQHPDERARAAAELIRTRSALSVAVTWEHLTRATQCESVGEVLAIDQALSEAFLPESEFVEGVRAQLVDKDRSPQWRVARLEDVDFDAVSTWFDGRPSETGQNKEPQDS